MRSDDRRDSAVSLWVKYVLFFFNFFFWLIGGVICCVGLWARAAYNEESTSIGLLSGWDFDPAIIFIFVGGLMFLLSFCGCVGALRENIRLLKFFTICLSIVFFVQLALGTIGFIFRHNIRKLATYKLTGTIPDYRNNVNLQNIIDYSQMTFGCCGLISYRDWRRNIYFNCSQKGQEACSVPYSCCKVDKLNTLCGYKMNSEKVTPSRREELIYTEGCIEGITKWFKSHFVVIGGVAVGIALLQIIVICFSAKLITDIRIQMAKWYQDCGLHEPLHSNDM